MNQRDGRSRRGDRLGVTVRPPDGSDLPPVHGTLTVSRVIPSGTHSIVGGPVVWDSDQDRHGVLAICYADLALSGETLTQS